MKSKSNGHWVDLELSTYVPLACRTLTHMPLATYVTWHGRLLAYPFTPSKTEDNTVFLPQIKAKFDVKYAVGKQ